MAGDKVERLSTIDALPGIDSVSNAPFAAHTPLQFSTPLRPFVIDDAERDLQLERALMSKDGEWSRLYGPPQTPKFEGFGVEIEQMKVPLKNSLTIWDLRSSSFDQSVPNSNFEERSQMKGPRFGLNWTKTF